jgi:hypothetical protein
MNKIQLFGLMLCLTVSFVVAEEVSRAINGKTITYVKGDIVARRDINTGKYYASELYIDENGMLAIKALDNPEEVYNGLERELIEMLVLKEKNFKEETE